MDSRKEETASILRSCLITTKNGSSLDNLNKDYRILEGQNIPFKQLGYATLEAFVQDIPGIKILRRGRDIWVEAIPSQESAHISRLIAGQKQSSSRRKKSRFYAAPPARRPQAMSAYRNMRNSDTRRNGSYQSIRNTGSSKVTTPPLPVTTYPPKPLMQQIIQPPVLSAASGLSRPRYTAPNSAAMASPSKRMVDRNIKPEQHLDYERNVKPVSKMPVTVYSPKISVITETAAEVAKVPPKIQQNNGNKATTPEIGSLGKMGPSTQHGTAKIKTGPSVTPPVMPNFATPNFQPSAQKPTFLLENPPITSIATPAPQQKTSAMTRSRICDRLNIQAAINFQNSVVTNGNGSIKVTFANVAGRDGDSPMTPVDQRTPNNVSSVFPKNPREELRMVARQLSLPEPVYKIFPFKGTHNGDKKVYAQVQVGAGKFSSYPLEVRTDIEAEMVAAEQALVALRLEHGDSITLPQTTNESLIKQRILAIVDQHNGIFIDKIQAYYQDEYKEKLPINWAKDAEKWQEITTEKGVNNTTILHRYIASAEPTPEPLTPKGDKVFLNPIGRVEPEPVRLPEESVYIVYVTTVVNPLEIWVRLFGDEYSNKFDIISAEMTEHYENMRYSITETVEIGTYCALKDDDFWHRVQVVDCDDVSGLAEVFFIDLGEYDTVSVNRLILLDKKFCLLSAQATKVSLAGLEEFPDCKTVCHRLENELMDRVFYIESLSREEDDDGRTVTNAVFYDTSGSEDINVNELISKKILQQLMTTIPTLNGERQVTEVYVSHAEPNGDVYVQIKSDGMKFLVNMLNKLIHTGMTQEELKKSALKAINLSKIYLTRCSETGDWYRAKILGIVPINGNMSHRCKMFLIDFGRTIIADAKDVLELEILCDVLTKLPPQAIQVQLQNIEPLMFTDKMVARLKELAPPSDSLLVRIVKPSCKESPSVIELFKRIQPHDVLVSINNTLALEPELSKSDDDGNNNVRPRKRVERTNSRVNGESEETAKALKPPRISDIGEYFDVHVTMAASPSNFTVQPHEYMGALAEMMAKLQDACAKYAGPQLTIESIREGRLFAAKHNDDMWYRVCISNVLDEHSVTVYFCDFGDVTLITLDKLQPLTMQFLELPYQAIKAKLVGIKPINIDWSADDSWYFQNLVVNRNYVSIIVESGPDKHSPGNNVLGLKLIDVSTDIDVYIAKQLVEEGRALFAD